MTANSEGIRRRKTRRFKIKGSAFVLLHRPPLMGIGRPRRVELGPITDISMGGIAVQYLEHKRRSLDAELLTIAVADDAFTIEGLYFRVVTDRILASLPGGRNIHTCSIEFTRLTAYQNFQLESFIKNYTIQRPQERRRPHDRRQFEDPRFQEPGYKVNFERRSGHERRNGWPSQ